MKNTSEKFGSDFILVLLDWTNDLVINDYEKFFLEKKIKYVNCKIPLINEMVLKDDYHPSEKAHSRYEECIITYMKKQNLIF